MNPRRDELNEMLGLRPEDDYRAVQKAEADLQKHREAKGKIAAQAKQAAAVRDAAEAALRSARAMVAIGEGNDSEAKRAEAALRKAEEQAAETAERLRVQSEVVALLDERLAAAKGDAERRRRELAEKSIQDAIERAVEVTRRAAEAHLLIYQRAHAAHTLGLRGVPRIGEWLPHFLPEHDQGRLRVRTVVDSWLHDHRR